MQRSPNEPSKASSRIGTVFYVTVAISAVFVLAGVLFTQPFGAALAAAASAITTSLGWAYLLATTFFLVFVLYLAFSRYGRVRLGQQGEEPEFGRFAWFAMLFQAGMGVGLVFWSVSEPVLHYADPPLGQAQPGTPAAADLALQYAYFHWTLHPWAIYALVGLAVAYFSFRRGMRNLRISAVFRPLLGDRVDGPVGKAIDVLAVVATLVGIAASLGQGTLQIDAGLATVFGLPSGVGLQLAIIAITAIAYMLSASTPINKGVNFLSQTSIYLAAVLVLYFLIVGPTLLQLNAFTQGLGGYLANVVPMSFNLSAFDPQSAWLGNWTIFFWATWIAWAPYVGVFIARISRGRTIREFVLGVLLAPSLFSMLWFAVFGAAGIDLDRRLGGAISEAASADAAAGLFAFLAEYPLAVPASLLAIFLVWIFFVAGADAGTIVLGSMSTDGALDPARPIKLTWGVIMASVAAILLVAGGLDAIQQAQILIAVPFGVVMVLIAWSLYRALRTDHGEQARHGQGGADHESRAEARSREGVS